MNNNNMSNNKLILLEDSIKGNILPKPVYDISSTTIMLQKNRVLCGFKFYVDSDTNIVTGIYSYFDTNISDPTDFREIKINDIGKISDDLETVFVVDDYGNIPCIVTGLILYLDTENNAKIQGIQLQISNLSNPYYNQVVNVGNITNITQTITTEKNTGITKITFNHSSDSLGNIMQPFISKKIIYTGSKELENLDEINLFIKGATSCDKWSLKIVEKNKKNVEYNAHCIKSNILLTNLYSYLVADFIPFEFTYPEGKTTIFIVFDIVRNIYVPCFSIYDILKDTTQTFLAYYIMNISTATLSISDIDRTYWLTLNSICIPSECQKDSDCKDIDMPLCKDNICVQCLNDNDCHNGNDKCDDGFCSNPNNCVTDSDCYYFNKSACVDEVCLQCIKSTDCNENESCINNICQPFMQCRKDSNCEVDEYCFNNICLQKYTKGSDLKIIFILILLSLIPLLLIIGIVKK